MRFTAEQQRAIDVTGKNLLVAAAAGSGKTAVLVERILQHLRSGWDINQLLVVTFTKAAAAEMSERIGLRLQREVEECRAALRTSGSEEREKLHAAIRHFEKQLILLPSASISTIHSFCQEIIRRSIDSLPLDLRFRVADTNEIGLLAQEILEDYLEECYDNEDEKLLRLSEKFSTDRGDEALCALIKRLYDAAQNQPRPELWLQRLSQSFAVSEESGIKDTVWWEPFLRRLQLETADLATLTAKMRLLQEQVLTLLGNDAGSNKNRKSLADFCDTIIANTAMLEQAIESGVWDSIRAAADASWKAKPRFISGFGDLSTAVSEINDTIKNKFKSLKGIMLASEAELLTDVRLLQSDVAALSELALGYGKRLAGKKREKNIIDFNDMEHFALAVLSAKENEEEFLPSEAALELRRLYKEVMVDEYQDTNKVQDTIFRLITGEDGKLFTVGDVKQSIYSFRAAEPSLFLQRYHAYRQPSSLPQELVCLTSNYRSRAEVLEAVNFIFAQVMQAETLEIDYDSAARLNNGLKYELPAEGSTVDKEVELLLVEKDSGDGEDESLKGFEAEARLIARRLLELKQSKVMVFDKEQDTAINNGYHEIRWRDMVVLLRAKSGKADMMLEALTAEGIPAYAEGSGGYFQATEVKLMLALLAVTDNLRQDIPLAAVLASPVAGLTAAELAEIRLGEEKGPLQADFSSAVLAGAAEGSGLRQDLQKKLQEFLQKLSVWRRLAREVSVPELIWQMYRDTGYYDYVGGLPGGLLRQANLRMLVSRAEQYEKTDFRGLFRFLRFVEKMRDNDTDLSVARTLGEGEDVVRVMTIHKSKGLEFPVVAVADLGKGFNAQDLSGDMLLHKDLGIGLKQTDVERRVKYPSLPWLAIKEKMELELRAEELRVLYVALTRAREKLILSGSINNLLTAGGESSSQKKRWSAMAQAEGQLLAPASLAKAKNYLDWIIPAVARHPDAEALREILETETDHFWLDAMTTSHWRITHIKESNILHQEKEQVQNEILEAVRQGNILTGGSEEEKLLVAQVLSWQYDFKGTENVPSKLSVSELKRRFATEEAAENIEQAVFVFTPDEKEPLIEQSLPPIVKEQKTASKADRLFRQPSFLQNKQKLSGAEYGTLLHCVLQHIDLQGGLTAHGIKAQLENMVQLGIISREEVKAVRLEQITSFYQSSIGQRLLAAKKVWRELPFCRLLPAQRFYDRVTDEKINIFSQGVIDLLFREADGGLVLVDYKTDRETNPEQVRARYQLQLDLYSEAIAVITGERVKEKYLYLLRDGSIVQC